MPSYKLINPIIKGNENLEFTTAVDENEAAKKIWSNMSQYFTDNVPNFNFTIEENNKGELFHYSVQEHVENGDIKYSIEKITINISPEQKEKFKKFIEEFDNKLDKTQAQSGGNDDSKYKKKMKKIYEDDSSDSDDDDEILYSKLNLYKKKMASPIYYWWYNPLLYTYYNVGYRSVYIPTFTKYIVPYVELNLSSSFF